MADKPPAQHRPPGKGKRNKNVFVMRDFTVRQEHCGMKVGTDALLLGGYAVTDKQIAPKLAAAAWDGTAFSSAAVDETPDFYGSEEARRSVRHILEIGCGSGVISLLLASQYPDAIISCVDIDNGAVAQCLLNIEGLEQEEWKQRIRVYHTPIQAFDPRTSRPCRLLLPGEEAEDDREVREEREKNEGEEEREKREEKEKEEMEEREKEAERVGEPVAPRFVPVDDASFESLEKPELFDLIICAPPYFLTDRKKCKLVDAMGDRRRIARHTHTLTMPELAEVVERLLVEETGRFNAICSLPQPGHALRDSVEDSMVLAWEELVDVTDCPGSKLIRTMYRAYRPSDMAAAPAPVLRHMAIYAGRYKKEDGKVHRTYSHQYRNMLWKFCNHIPSDEAEPAIEVTVEEAVTDDAKEEAEDTLNMAKGQEEEEQQAEKETEAGKEPEEPVELLTPNSAAGPTRSKMKVDGERRWSHSSLGRTSSRERDSPAMANQRVRSDPQYSGLVFKKKLKRTISAWNKRHFVLRDGVLKIYLSSEQQGVVPPRRAFPMRDVKVRIDKDPGEDKLFAFFLDVAIEDCFYHVAVDSQEELDHWTDALVRARKAAQVRHAEELLALASKAECE